MIEMRWLRRGYTVPVLQYRVPVTDDHDGLIDPEWSDWKDVPEVDDDEQNDE